MPELDAFERRLADGLVAYAREMPGRVDAHAVARRVAGEARSRTWLPVEQQARRVAWLLAAAALLAVVTGLLAVGSWLIDRTREPRLPNHGITVMAPSDGGSPGVVMDEVGAVWILTSRGLARLDAANGPSRSWTQADDLAFAALGIAPARSGGVWLLGPGPTIRRFDGDRLGEPLRLPADAKDVMGVAEAPDRTLWAATLGGLYRRADGAWAVVPGQPDGVSDGAVALDPGGAVWVTEIAYPGAVPAGLARFDGRTWTRWTEDSSGAALPASYALAADGAGSAWAASEAGLLRFDGSQWITIRAEDLGAAGSWTPAVGPGGDVWAATSFANGPVQVAHLDHGAWSSWGTDAGLPGPDASGSSSAAIAAGPAGPIVAVQGSAYRLAGGRWERAWTDPWAASVWIRNLAAASARDAWAIRAGDTPVVLHLTPSGVVPLAAPAGATDLADIAVARDGTVWLATDAGVAVGGTSGWTIADATAAVSVTVEPDGTALAMSSISELREFRRDGTGAGWAVTELPGSMSIRDTNRTYGGLGPQLAIDQAGHVWANGGAFGYDHAPGLRRYDGQAWQRFTPTGTLSNTVFNTVLAAPDGSIWVTIDGTGDSTGCCTEPDPGAQVARFDGQRWTVFGAADGLPAETSSRSLAVTPDGTVWLAGPAGLYRFDGAAWRSAIPDHLFEGIVAAPDGALWTSGHGALRIGDPAPLP